MKIKSNISPNKNMQALMHFGTCSGTKPTRYNEFKPSHKSPTSYMTSKRYQTSHRDLESPPYDIFYKQGQVAKVTMPDPKQLSRN